MSEAERSQWIAILDAAAMRPGDEMNNEWEWLLERLGLPEDYFLAVLEAIRQGRWRNAKNPRTYVKTVAKREARKMGLDYEPDGVLELVAAPTNGAAFSMEAALDHCAYLGSTSEAVKGDDGVWRPGGGSGDYDEIEDNEEDSDRVSFRDVIAKGLAELKEPPADLVRLVANLNAQTNEHHLEIRPSWDYKWDKWADLAGFDEWDRAVLSYKVSSVSRDCALAEQPDDPSRRALQAAWRKFGRTGLARLRAGIKKVNPKNVPESRIQHTSK
jgi:hypothetical protein